MRVDKMGRLTEQEYASYITTFEGMSYKELAETFKKMKDANAEADNELKKQKEIFDILRLKVIPEKLDNEGMSSINIKGVGRLGVTLDMNVSVLAENRDRFYEWLEESGHGGIIKPYAQPSTVKAFVKEEVKLAAEERREPDLPQDLVDWTPFYRASVTKS